MGRLVIADIGLSPGSRLVEIARPHLAAPGPDDYKYSRGYVAVIAGEMPGACALAASAAARSGAGYVRIVGDAHVAGVPLSVAQGGKGKLDDPRIGAFVIGPGLGASDDAARRLGEVPACDAPAVIDADALNLLARLGTNRLHTAKKTPVLTPHAGEFARLFPNCSGSKVEQARSAAVETGAVIVFKGPDTVVAAPDGRAAIAPPAPVWLSTAGTGDVLSGIVAAMRARGLDAFEAACAGVWLHGRAAEHAGPALIADDLLAPLPDLIAGCR
jgi:hydroxyethylthiazole kinase-like uncharacterized protein yjeF